MAIGHFIKEIGRGKEGARALSRAQSADLFGQILDGSVSDLEIGAFCLAMRIKGETTEEMCGFWDATQQRMAKIQISPTHNGLPAVVIPTYNGARKLPVLTPLLALLLAREGFAVVLHGTATEGQRVFTSAVLTALGIQSREGVTSVRPGEVPFFPTKELHGGLQALLDVRRVVQLRNPAHSLVKMLLPCDGPQLLVTSYTHPEYAASMESVLQALGATSMLLRGTEGEAVADARRLPKMTCLRGGLVTSVHEQQAGSLSILPDLPTVCDAQTTAHYIQSVLSGASAVPAPIATQVDRIMALARA
jgi:anthranilate phosphoribosyltransferase